MSVFEEKVWSQIKKIPRGKTVTYSEIARRIGMPKAARAVGNAVGKNPFPVVVPCHRVVRSDGKLGGYSGPGGIRRKRELLRRERSRPFPTS